ncbi:MAG: hypothetical protein AB7I37_26185 [Pirellulales bacterium]
MATTTAKQEVDTKYLYGHYQKARDWREDFMKENAYKATDTVPPEDMNITKTNTGIGTLGAVGIGAISGLPGLVLAAAMLLKGDPAPQPPTAPAAVSPADSEYEVLFYNAKGELIDVPRRKTQ